jgi:hypothetical protein
MIAIRHLSILAALGFLTVAQPVPAGADDFKLGD